MKEKAWQVWHDNFNFVSHYTFLSSLSCFQCISPWPLFSAVHDSPPLPYFFQSPPKFTLFSPNCLLMLVSNQGEGCCAVVWALGLAFHGEEAFHATECVVDIQWGSILSTQHRDCLLDRQARGGDGGTAKVSSPLYSSDLSLHSHRPEPIPPQSLGDKLNMIRRHHTGLESRGRGSHQDVASSPFLICMEIRSRTARTANTVAVWEM